MSPPSENSGCREARLRTSTERSGLTDIEDAAHPEGGTASTENAHRPAAGIHIEIVVGKYHVAVITDNLHHACIGVGVHGDQIAVSFERQVRVGKMEVLGSTEQRGTGGNRVSIHEQCVGEIVPEEVRIRELHVRQPDRGQSGHGQGLGAFLNLAGLRVAQGPLDFDIDRIERFIGNVQPCPARDGADQALIVDIGSVRVQAGLFTGEQNRGKEAAGCIVQGLPAAVVVDGCPGGNRPAAAGRHTAGYRTRRGTGKSRRDN